MEVEWTERVVVGLTSSRSRSSLRRDLLQRWTPGGRDAEGRAVEELRTHQDNAKVNEELEKLKKAAAGDENSLMPFILNAVRQYATLGEISRW